MKRGIFLILVLAVCLMVPLTTEADSLYIGDYCWETNIGEVFIFSAFFLGYDSRGHEIINYIGRWKGGALGLFVDFPMNGNCIDTFDNNKRVYKCNLLTTFDYENALMFAEFDYFTLDGDLHGVLNLIQGNSVVSEPIPNYTVTPIACSQVVW
jgi:hypothetical protein